MMLEEGLIGSQNKTKTQSENYEVGKETCSSKPKHTLNEKMMMLVKRLVGKAKIKHTLSEKMMMLVKRLVGKAKRLEGSLNIDSCHHSSPIAAASPFIENHTMACLSKILLSSKTNCLKTNSQMLTYQTV